MGDFINVDNLSFGYAGSEEIALDGITFAAKRGEIVLIIGASGSGKTTLLRMFDKSMMPEGRYTGDVQIMGQSVNAMSRRECAQRVGFVGQNPDNQIVTDKVWHELAFGLENIGVSVQDIRRRTAEMSEYFGITDWYNRNTDELSGGQKQLLNLASVMVMRPDVLLLDEPTAQLDPLSKKKLLDTVTELNRDFGITVICVEHNLSNIFSEADRVLALDNGRLICNMPPERTAQFLIDSDSPLFLALPSAARIYRGTNAETDSDFTAKESTECRTHVNAGAHACPLTVKEGRAWVDSVMRARGLTDALGGEPDVYFHTSGDAAVTVKNVIFRYTKNGDNILNDISFSVKKGSVTALLGSNGKGKTTLLKIMSGIAKPLSGKVKTDGRIAVMPQNPIALFTEISVEEELAAVLTDRANSAVQGLSKQEKTDMMEDMLEKTGLIQLRQRHPYDLSGGQQQKLAMAKILMLKPDIIMLDEPTKGLDAFFCRQLGEWLNELKSEGRTIILVSHDIEFTASYADYCGLIFDGNIESLTDTRRFFLGNTFFTTDAGKIMSDYFKDCMTCEDAIAAISNCKMHQTVLTD